MKQYIGTKIIQAEPAYRLDKKTVQPADWPIPAGSQADMLAEDWEIVE